MVYFSAAPQAAGASSAAPQAAGASSAAPQAAGASSAAPQAAGASSAAPQAAGASSAAPQEDAGDSALNHFAISLSAMFLPPYGRKLYFICIIAHLKQIEKYALFYYIVTFLKLLDIILAYDIL